MEIRQCPLKEGSLSGTIQLAAWSRNAATPALVLDLEESGFFQMAMIQGVYAFELMGGKASQALVIRFEGGSPSVVFKDSSLGGFEFRSTTDALVVTSKDKDAPSQAHVFSQTGSPSGRK